MLALSAFTLAFVVALALLRIVLARPLEKTRWFKTHSVRLALWAAGWAVAVMGVSAAIELQHPALEALALAPIVSILISMFLLVIIEAPVFWWDALQTLVGLFKRDR